MQFAITPNFFEHPLIKLPLCFCPFRRLTENCRAGVFFAVDSVSVFNAVLAKLQMLPNARLGFRHPGVSVLLRLMGPAIVRSVSQ